MQNEFDKNEENNVTAPVTVAEADIEEKNREENTENKSEENIEENAKVKEHINKNPNMSSPIVEKSYSVHPVIDKNLEEAKKLQKTQDVNELDAVQEIEEPKEAAKTEEIGESEEIKEIKSDLADAIKENDIREIFDYFDIGVFMYRDGTCGLSEYRQPSETITYGSLGINEEKLLEDVVKISGNADFRKSSLKSFGKIKFIGGCADFRDSNFTLKMKLPKIGARVIFYDNQTLFQGIIIKIITSIRSLLK